VTAVSHSDRVKASVSGDGGSRPDRGRTERGQQTRSWTQSVDSRSDIGRTERDRR